MAMKRSNHQGTIEITPNKTYRAQIMIDRQRYSKTFPTARQANRWLREKEELAHRGLSRYLDQPLKSYLTEWFAIQETANREKTNRDYKRYVFDYIIPHIGEIPLEKLTPLKIDQYYQYLHRELGKSACTIKHLHMVLHRALQYGVEKHILTQNPAHHAQRPRYEKKEKIIWSLNEIRRFFTAAALTEYELVYFLAVKTGMRQSELFGLQWHDLDWDQQTIHVQRQIVRKGKGNWHFGPLKTKAADRIIPLSNQTMEKLCIHRQFVDIIPELFNYGWEEHNLLLPSERGTPMYQGNVRTAMKKLIGQTNVTDITFHDLRHTTASVMLNANLSPVEVSRFLGHESVSVTLDTYTHFIPAMHIGKVETIDEVLNLAG